MELTGTLQSFPLAELLDMMQHSSMCGVLEIQARAGTGRIWVRDGVICHADYGGEQGRSALWPLFDEPNASFVVRADGEHPWGPPGLGDAQSLISNAQEQRALWKPIRQRLPSLDMVPLAAKSKPARSELSDLDWNVLVAIDGKHSIRQLTEPTILDLLDVCRAVIRLLDAGLIEIRQPDGTAWREPPKPQSGLPKRPIGTPVSAQADTPPPPPTGLLGRIRRPEQ